MSSSIRESMGRSRRFFLERSTAASTDEERSLYEHMRQVSACVEETASLVEHLRVQLDDVRRAIGLHLESQGAVPHTRRARAKQPASS